MSLVNILQVSILNNPCDFFSPVQFEITFEVISELAEDLEFKIVYVGSASGPDNDQVLESVMVGPVPLGVSKFAPAPNPDLIPKNDLIGLTVMLLCVSYMDKEFIRVGYYVNNDYLDEEMRENPPDLVNLSKLQRNILADKPRVTRFPIQWGNETTANPQHQQFLQTQEQVKNVEMMQQNVNMEMEV